MAQESRINPPPGSWEERFIWEEERRRYYNTQTNNQGGTTRTTAATTMSAAANNASRVLRTTMFRIADPANQRKLIQAYNKLAAEQKKDGKPYILYMAAGIAVDPARSRGYTVVARSEFASMEDMRWYDEECPAHKALKETARAFDMPEPPLVIYHEDVSLVNLR